MEMVDAYKVKQNTLSNTHVPTQLIGSIDRAESMKLTFMDNICFRTSVDFVGVRSRYGGNACCTNLAAINC